MVAHLPYRSSLCCPSLPYTKPKSAPLNVSRQKPLLLIHSDIKPSNMMVTHAGSAKLVDFGGARYIEVDGESDTDLACGSTVCG